MPVLVHALWHLHPESRPLTPEIVERLRPYLFRYAQTLGVALVAVGGGDDHLHLLFDLPPARTPEQVTTELQPASARFVRDVVDYLPFAWEGARFDGVSATDRNMVASYIEDNAARHACGDTLPEWEGDPDRVAAPDDTPEWLRDALRDARGGPQPG